MFQKAFYVRYFPLLVIGQVLMAKFKQLETEKNVEENRYTKNLLSKDNIAGVVETVTENSSVLSIFENFTPCTTDNF